jgi:hypothetical protein
MSKQQIDEAELAIYGRLDTLNDEDRDEVLRKIYTTYESFYKLESKKRLDECLKNITFSNVSKEEFFYDGIEDMKKHSPLSYKFPMDSDTHEEIYLNEGKRWVSDLDLPAGS